jgi:hypothetical protein
MKSTISHPDIQTLKGQQIQQNSNNKNAGKFLSCLLVALSIFPILLCIVNQSQTTTNSKLHTKERQQKKSVSMVGKKILWKNFVVIFHWKCTFFI